MALIKQSPAIKRMRIGIELELTRMLSDAEYERLERAGISVYGSSDGKSARYEFGCHNTAELQFASEFLGRLK